MGVNNITTFFVIMSPGVLLRPLSQASCTYNLYTLQIYYLYILYNSYIIMVLEKIINVLIFEFLLKKMYIFLYYFLWIKQSLA